MKPGNNSLVLKSNRMLGANLVDRNLIQLCDLEAANEKFLHSLRSEDDKRPSLLNILLYDLQSLDEGALIDHQIEFLNLGFSPLGNYRISDTIAEQADIEECWATWTIPVDEVSDVHFLATAYYLSPFVRQRWEDKLGAVVWYAATTQEIGDLLEKWEQRQKGPQVEDEAEAAAAGG